MTTNTPLNDADLSLPQATPQTLAAMELATLRGYRKLLTEEEEKVSYWRRLVQFRVNLINEQKKSAEVLSAQELIRSLGSTGSGHRRLQLLSVDAQEELPQLPGIDELWTAAIDPSDEEGTRRLLEELTSVERRLSEYRARLHTRIDAATAELISRYKANPDLSLDLFPQDVR